MSLKNVINCMLQFLDVPMEYLRHAIVGMDTFLSVYFPPSDLQIQATEAYFVLSINCSFYPWDVLKSLTGEL